MAKDTYNAILGNTETPPAGGKAVAGQDPALVQQDATNVQQGATKAVTGVAPELRQQTVESAIPSAAPLNNQVQTQGTAQAQQPVAPTAPKQLSYVEMMQMAYPYQPPSQEELEKERKREKNARMWAAIGDGVAAMANIYFAGKSGYSNYDPKSSMSAKVNARAEQLHKEREANAKSYFSLYMQAKAHDDANAQAERRLRQQEQSAEQQRKQWEDSFKYRQDRDKADDARRAEEQAYKREQDRLNREDAAKKFQESQRQFNLSYSINKEKVAQDQAKNMYTFFIGDETLSIPKDALNAETISSVFHALPENVQRAAQESLGEPIMDSRKKKVTGHKPLTADQMLTAIGAAIGDSEEAQYRMRILAGQKPKKPKKGPKDFSQNKVGTTTDDDFNLEQYAE